MKMRSSGLPMFLAAYLICVMFVACLIVIKSDATFRNDEIIAPAIQPLVISQPRRNLVVMNPIKKPVPPRRTLPGSRSNIMLALLPADSQTVLAEKRVAKSKLLNAITSFSRALSNMRITFEPPVTTPTTFVQARYRLTQNRSGNPSILLAPKLQSHPPIKSNDPNIVFSRYFNEHQLASQKRILELPQDNPRHPLDRQTGKDDKAGRKSHQQLSERPTKIVSDSNPFGTLARDTITKERIMAELKTLKQIDVRQTLVMEIIDGVEIVFQQAELDYGQCESSMYRLINDLYSLEITDSSEEDQRALDASRSRVISEIRVLLDLLEFAPPTLWPVQPIEQIDLENHKVALK
ncbi:hypothetical protein OAG51_02355 [Pirellulaceae bacterium]|nr:hypothetical protein [Pirellulaceae bacterium]